MVHSCPAKEWENCHRKPYLSAHEILVLIAFTQKPPINALAGNTSTRNLKKKLYSSSFFNLKIQNIFLGGSMDKWLVHWTTKLATRVSIPGSCGIID